MSVTADVVASCSITANDLAFGDYDPVSSTPLDMATTIEVTCTNGADYTVSLDEGLGSGASIAVRKMTAGSDTLNYSLYRDAGRNDVWGETDNVNNVDGTGNGTLQSIDVFGRIPSGQTAPEGNYTDTITATVEY
jgi:spore coat protein U-like protein